MSGQDAGGSLQDKTQALLADFFAQGEVLVRELIEENERLKDAISRTGTSVPAKSVPEGVVERLMSKVDRLEAECAEIRTIAGSVKRQSGGYRGRLEALEGEHYQMAAMYVAGNQFHLSVSVEDVLRTITEILLNFVGAGRFTIYGVDEERDVAFPITREGGDPAERDELALAGDGAAATMSRAAWRGGDSFNASEEALMHLPLVSGSRLVGVARIEAFLPQKTEFEDNDRGLLELISQHAGIAIEAAWVRAHATDAPIRRDAVEKLVGG